MTNIEKQNIRQWLADFVANVGSQSVPMNKIKISYCGYVCTSH